jgi:porin
VAALALVAAAPVDARAAADDALDFLRTTPRLAGDPAGLRSRAERLGLSVQLFAQEYWAWKPRGGVERDGVTGHSGSYDLLVRLDLEELLGRRDLVAFLQVKGQYDRHPNETVGAFSDPADDADFDEGAYVDQLWFEKGWLDGRVRLRAGFVEFQTVFDRNAYANREDVQFMNSVLDNDPLVPLPNALGAALIVRPWPRLELALGVGDADNPSRRAGFETFFDDADSLAAWLEASWTVRLGPGGRLPGRYRVGMFRDGRKREVFGRTTATGAPGTDRGHLGFYLSVDQALWRPDARGDRGVGVFARVARADPDTSPSEWFWSTGLEWAGPAAARPDDALGVAVYQLVASDELRRAKPGAFHRETGLEIYYRLEPLPWLAVTPDLQYIVEPGASPAAGDAIVFQLRFRVSF